MLVWSWKLDTDTYAKQIQGGWIWRNLFWGREVPWVSMGGRFRAGEWRNWRESFANQQLWMPLKILIVFLANPRLVYILIHSTPTISDSISPLTPKKTGCVYTPIWSVRYMWILIWTGLLDGREQMWANQRPDIKSSSPDTAATNVPSMISANGNHGSWSLLSGRHVYSQQRHCKNAKTISVVKHSHF